MQTRDALSNIPAANPHEGNDTRPTPFAQAVVPASVPPDSVESVNDHRVDRLLAENLALMVERSKLYTNLRSVQDRSSELLNEARKAKKLVRAYLEARDSGVACAAVSALEALTEWAHETL